MRSRQQHFNQDFNTYMKRHVAIFAFLMVALLSCSRQESMDNLCDRVFQVASVQLEGMHQELPEGQLPRTVNPDGTLATIGIFPWISGFYPGALWLEYEATGDEKFSRYATQYTEMLDTLKTCAGSHDIGFQMNCSYGNGLRLKGTEAYKDVLVTAAQYLAGRFSPVVGCTRSWNSGPEQFLVIVDNMMNLELLMVAYELSGNETFRDIAVTHANTTLKNHYRDDWSSWHVVVYNPEDGSVIKKRTAQGFSDDSAWARGQSWGLYGYTMMYRFTKDPVYLDAACHIADYLIPRLPEDCVPYWDYDSDEIPDDIRDASAASIMASALVELSTFVSGKQSRNYLSIAEKIVRTLASPEYLAEPGTNNNFLLKHSVGSKPGRGEVDVPLTYADYYFLEALLRYRKLNTR